jgi:hypothetical protein
MENKYTIKTAFRFDPKPEDDVATYGYRWYCTVEEMQYPVMFNLKGEDTTVQELDRITYDEQKVGRFKSGKNAGKEYRQLTKVKVEEGAPRIVQEDTFEASLVPTDLEARVKKLEDKVFGEDPFADLPPEFMN